MDSASDQVAMVRDFNRDYTRRLGVLTDRYLGQRRPLGEARLLFEIGVSGDVRAIRTRLGLDSGYLSRLLRALAEQGLIEVLAHPHDRRARVAELTAAGARELAELNRRSDAAIGELLAPLTADQREELVAAQRQMRRLLRLATVGVDAVDPHSAVARRCLSRYAAELAIRFPEGYDRAALVAPGELADGAGVFLVAREADHAVGCAVWRTLGPGVAEVRHLWVSEDARGLGIGRRLLRELEAGAVARGVATLRLGTHPALTEAIALYRSSGYREVPPYDDSPYNQLGFEKVIPGRPPR